MLCEFQVGIYEDITGIEKVATYRKMIPVDGPEIEGYGELKDHFPLQYPVRFTITTATGNDTCYILPSK